MLLCAAPCWVTLVGCLQPIEWGDWEDNDSGTKGKSYKTGKSSSHNHNPQKGPEDQEDKIKAYYKILRLPYGASYAEIKKAYKVLARKYHPDKNPNNKAAEAIFKKVNEAHLELKDFHSKGR